MSRIQNSVRNIKFAVVGQLFALIISFISRKIFVMTLGEEYLGLNGLFTNILYILSVSEMGIGTAIIYSMYRPLAENDNEKIKSLMNLYKKAYRCIGCFVGVVGLSITPFIPTFISDIPDIPNNIYLIYIMYVFNSSVSYFFIYKRSLIIADQNRYIATVYRYAMYFIVNICQIIILLLTHNYYLYLILMILNTLVENILVSKKANKLYPFLKDKEIKPLDSDDKKEITKNISALICHKLGGAIVNGTDNIIMSRMINVAVVGIYSNYYMVSNALSTIYGLVFQSITASFGNLSVEADDWQKLRVFNQLFFMGAWFACFCTTCLIVLFNPFIQLWLGEQYLFSFPVVIIITINFYIKTVRQPVLTAKEAMGLFWYDRYRSLFEALINIFTSIIFCVWLRKYGAELGVLGVFIGTMLTSLCTNLWIEPKVLYNYGFKSGVGMYFKKYYVYTIVTLISSLLTYKICFLFPLNFSGFMFKSFICLLIPNILFIAIFWRTDEFIGCKSLVRTLLNKFKRKSYQKLKYDRL